MFAVAADSGDLGKGELKGEKLKQGMTDCAHDIVSCLWLDF
jgi:hypothetical protein